MRFALRLLVVSSCAFMALAVRAEPAVTVRAVDLKQTPAADAKTVASVPAESAVDLVTRQGAWVQLKSGKNTGWAKLFDVRLGQPGVQQTKSGATGNTIAQTLNLAAGTRGSTVTTGVRGLDADTLKNAVPNPQQVIQLDRYAVQKPEAETFARAGRLSDRTIDPLAAPTKGASR